MLETIAAVLFVIWAFAFISLEEASSLWHVLFLVGMLLMATRGLLEALRNGELRSISRRFSEWRGSSPVEGNVSSMVETVVRS